MWKYKIASSCFVPAFCDLCVCVQMWQIMYFFVSQSCSTFFCMFFLFFFALFALHDPRFFSLFVMCMFTSTATIIFRYWSLSSPFQIRQQFLMNLFSARAQPMLVFSLSLSLWMSLVVCIVCNLLCMSGRSSSLGFWYRFSVVVHPPVHPTVFSFLSLLSVYSEFLGANRRLNFSAFIWQFSPCFSHVLSLFLLILVLSLDFFASIPLSTFHFSYLFHVWWINSFSLLHSFIRLYIFFHLLFRRKFSSQFVFFWW